MRGLMVWLYQNRWLLGWVLLASFGAGSAWYWWPQRETIDGSKCVGAVRYVLNLRQPSPRLPIYPGSRLISDSSPYGCVWQSAASASDIRAFYRAEMPRFGWVIPPEMTFDQGSYWQHPLVEGHFPRNIVEVVLKAESPTTTLIMVGRTQGNFHPPI